MDESNAGISQIFIAPNNDLAEWKSVGVIDESLPVQFHDPTKYTYYMRRGHRYYFRQFGSRISMYLRELPMELKYGQEICLDITFKS